MNNAPTFRNTNSNANTDNTTGTSPFLPPTFAPPAPTAAIPSPPWSAPRFAEAPTMIATPGPGHGPEIARRGRRIASLVAAAAIIGISVVALGIQQGNSRVATAATAAESEATVEAVPDAEELPEQTTPAAPPAAAPAESAPDSTEAPAVVLPINTAPTTTAPQPTAHSLSGVVAGSCLLDGTPVPCARGTELVTYVASNDQECSTGETTLTVTESASVPQVVIVCLVPWSLDDRSLAQAFTLDATCGQQAVEDTLTFEIDGLVCTDSAGVDYILVKVAEGQMVPYLSEVLGATFIGDFTVEDGQVCGGQYQIDGWDVWVYGYGPFVEFRPAGDTGSVRFARSLCAA
jgi:hypothetical protein